MTITWHTETRKLSDLKDYEDNPRILKTDAFNRLVQSIKENGYTNRLIVNVDGTVLGGNMRLKALKYLGIEEIEVLIPDRELTHDEIKRINIVDNIHAGSWDTDKLIGLWDMDSLKAWGINEKLFDIDKEIEKKVANKKLKQCPECGAEF